jgi:hypothetical protein
MTQKKILAASASVIIAMVARIFPAAAIPIGVFASFSNRSAYNAVLVDNRLYRHCHNVGRFVRCYTADPWSPEHMKFDRLQGRLHHEGGPEGPVDKQSYKKLRHPC